MKTLLCLAVFVCVCRCVGTHSEKRFSALAECEFTDVHFTFAVCIDRWILYHVRWHRWCICGRLLTTCTTLIECVAACGRIHNRQQRRRWIERHRTNTIDVHVIYEIITVIRWVAGYGEKHFFGRRHWKCWLMWCIVCKYYRSICTVERRKIHRKQMHINEFGVTVVSLRFRYIANASLSSAETNLHRFRFDCGNVSSQLLDRRA